MEHLKIAPKVYYLGIDDKKTQYFEGIWPILYGISYNAYLIKDNKIALIEGGVKVDFSRAFLNNISHIIDPAHIDYIIVNHMEPDHTGTLPMLYKIASNAKIIITSFGKKLLSDFYGIGDENRIITVKDGDKINLGEIELLFFTIPGVHWPDTMVTYDTFNKILFSGDAFGTFGALNGKIFDDEINVNFYLSEARRYFANIVGMYTQSVQNALKKLKSLEIKIIAPSHGPIWRANPGIIIQLYDKLSRYEAENKVLIIHGSMYGFTDELANYIARKLVSKGVKVSMHSAVNQHPSFAIGEAWDSKVILFGSPTYDGSVFPPVFYTAYLLWTKRLKNKHYGIFGSFGWSGKGYVKLIDLFKPLNWELIEPIIEIRGRLRKENFKQIDELINSIISLM